MCLLAYLPTSLYNVFMIEFFQAIFIGLVQGTTEFLPISSSAHLVAIPYIFNWQYNGLAFDVALHFGTVIAIIAFFWRDWLSIVVRAIPNFQLRPFDSNSGRSELVEDQNSKFDRFDYPKNLLWQILVASIPAAIIGFLIQDLIEKSFHGPMMIAINLILFGLILWFVDTSAKKNSKIKDISFGQSFLVGIAQSIALVPGVSRSGITMIASRGIGLKRESAARFSFLLGTPAMIGAFLLKFKDLTPAELTLPFFISVATSAIVGFLAIKFLLNYLKKSNFSIFLWYRIAFAALIIITIIYRR